VAHEQVIGWVAQEEPYGCGCAAVAMIVGVSYMDIKSYVERDFDKQGMTSSDWQLVLAELGYACQIIHRVKQYPWRNCERNVWPPEPWAQVHLCEVIVPGSAHGSHMVVMEADGKVLDPMTPEPKWLGDYEHVLQVAGVTHAPTIPQRLLRVHRCPGREF
jgi:hypothetical protein